MRRPRSFSRAAVRSGAYQAGVYQALAEAGCVPDWLSGISIGAINAAIIAGNEPDMRLPRLRHFWKQSTSSFRWPALDFGGDMRRLFNYTSAISSLLSGQPGFFQPRFIPPLLQPHGAYGVLNRGRSIIRCWPKVTGCLYR